MTVVVLDGGPDGHPRARLAVAAGEWAAVVASAPERFVRAVAGLAPWVGSIRVDDVELVGKSPPLRAQLGLGTVRGRVPDLPGLRVGEVLLLGAPTRVPTWQVLIRTHGARAAERSAGAEGHALAGQLGLGGWWQRPAVDLPPVVAALVDVGRCLARQPRALVWRRPEWLVAEEQALVRDRLRRAAGRAAVIEVAASGPGLAQGQL